MIIQVFASSTVMNFIKEGSLPPLDDALIRKFNILTIVYILSQSIISLKITIPPIFKQFLGVNDMSNKASSYFKMCFNDNGLYLGFIKSITGNFCSNGIYAYLVSVFDYKIVDWKKCFGSSKMALMQYSFLGLVIYAVIELEHPYLKEIVILTNIIFSVVFA